MIPHTTSPLLGVARLGLVEWWRTRWPRLLVLCMAAAGGIGIFAEALAVTESVEIRLTLQGAATRFLVVTAFALLLIVNTVRDANDGVLDFVLARPVARWQWWLGKFLSCTLVAVLSAGVSALPLLAGAAPVSVIAWAGSLACELVVMAAAALTFALGLRQVTLAFAATMAFYLLCRTMQSLVLLSRDALLDTGTLLHSALGAMLRGLALLLPDLGRYTQSAWLVGTGPGAGELAFILLQTLLGASLLALLGIIDFSARRH
jgi:Cu-processing system permease protein